MWKRPAGNSLVASRKMLQVCLSTPHRVYSPGRMCMCVYWIWSIRVYIALVGAVKRLKSHLITSDEQLHEFVSEGQCLKQLHHPWVPRSPACPLPCVSSCHSIICTSLDICRLVRCLVHLPPCDMQTVWMSVVWWLPFHVFRALAGPAPLCLFPCCTIVCCDTIFWRSES